MNIYTSYSIAGKNDFITNNIPILLVINNGKHLLKTKGSSEITLPTGYSEIFCTIYLDSSVTSSRYAATTISFTKESIETLKNRNVSFGGYYLNSSDFFNGRILINSDGTTISLEKVNLNTSTNNVNNAWLDVQYI